jgi:hypothetical protein
MAKKNATENTAPTTLEEALIVIASQNTKIEELEAGAVELNKIIEEVRASKKGDAKPSFTLNGKTYQVNAGTVIYNKEKVSAAEICENKDLQKELVELGAGYLEEINQD